MTGFECINEIRVERNSNNKLVIYNPSKFPLVGQGKHGALFKLEPQICIKIFADEDHAQVEGSVYKDVDGSPIIPRLYEIGDNYIIMEYIDGPDLKEYLLKKGSISYGDCKRILLLFEEMKKLGFKRLDESLRHILVADNKALKIVDLYYSFTLNNPHPIKFLNQLGDIGLLNKFISSVKELDINTYNQWISYLPLLIK